MIAIVVMIMGRTKHKKNYFASSIEIANRMDAPRWGRSTTGQISPAKPPMRPTARFLKCLIIKDENLRLFSFLMFVLICVTSQEEESSCPVSAVILLLVKYAPELTVTQVLNIINKQIIMGTVIIIIIGKEPPQTSKGGTIKLTCTADANPPQVEKLSHMIIQCVRNTYIE